MMRSGYLLALLCSTLLPAPLAAQAVDTASASWNGERALELIQRAQARRQEAHTDTGLVNYQAQARAFVYFYLDRQDTGERNLVKTDQLALQVFWQAPDQVKQRIVGWRDEKSLPTNIHYHLDHLSVVQENFGNEIRIGDGDEVRGVPHPAAPRAERVYDYRLVDSLTLRLPGAPEPVRVYQLQVRPREPSRPGFLGSVFVDQRSGDLVRMDFTFTAASYVDRNLDYINLSLDNGLWKGRFWLPNEQRVELRRRIPQLDIPAGSVIRASMRVGEYVFNQPMPPALFAGPTVVTVPRAQRESFQFEEELHAEVRAEGLGPQVELAEIRRQAERLVREEALRRVAGVRLRIPRASEVVRYNRAEGVALSAGLTFSPLPTVRAGVLGGWAFGAEHPVGQLDLRTALGDGLLHGSLYLNRPRDVGVGPAASGAINTVSTLFAGRDYTDLYYADGGSLSFERRLSPAWRLAAGVRAEKQSSAELTTDFSVFDAEFRPVMPIQATDLMLGGSLWLRRGAPAGAARWWTLGLGLEGGRGEYASLARCSPAPCPERSLGFLHPRLEAGLGRAWAPGQAELEARLQAGTTLGETVPAQEMYLLGGRGTIPGYPFRGFVGQHFAALNAVGSLDVARPWVRGRLLGAAGWANRSDLVRLDAPGREARPTDGLRTSLGVGVGLLHDIFHVDLARGLNPGGEWELIVDVQRAFWDFL